MAEKMTLLGRVEAALPVLRNMLGSAGLLNGQGIADELLRDVRAHIAQPAQAVDALQDAIFQIAERLGEVRDPDMDDMSWHTQLIARAQYLANAQAVDVALVREVIVELRDKAEVPALIRAQSLADKLTRAIGNAQAEGN
ncbi:hypothetical protein UU9_12548 [Rhodanobacter fulvus Jip2]|uniref:Uncharacterized protein n=1 Tax=Rhodanobacter fulvus Jip2 TaxID=1163408 RepID=I4VMY8_9GAMM|nr:hypothetical protein [Rhodanobacter fulvus]EIL88579.1 hypothetical protein UU9_12548 [Rhodanobacter fulvus Jip2]